MPMDEFEVEFEERFGGEDTTWDEDRADAADEVMDPLRAFLRYLDTVQSEYTFYCKALGVVDSQRQDILHYLELRDTNASDRSQLVKKLIEVSKRRRYIKDRCTLYQIAMDRLVKPNLIKYTKDLGDAIKSMRSSVGEKYAIRTGVLEEVFGDPNLAKGMRFVRSGVEEPRNQ